MTKSNKGTEGGLSRRGFLAGGPGLLMVGALAAPAILSPDTALASSPKSQRTIRFVDQTLASLRSRSPSIASGTLDITAFQRSFDKGNTSHSVFVHYRGNRTASFLINQKVDLAGRSMGPLTWQLLPSSIRTMPSLSETDETGHGQRLERGVIDHRELERRLRSNQGYPSGMANATYEKDVLETKHHQTWIKQFRHNDSGRQFFVFSNHHAVGSESEWRYVMSKDLSSATATRFYAMRDAERSVTTATLAIGGAAIITGVGAVAAVAGAIPTAGASLTVLVTMFVVVGATIADRHVEVQALADAHQRYSAQFLSPFTSDDKSGYLLQNSSVVDWDAEFDALGIS